ncbi:MAG: hypothetical protein VXZ35_05475 [Pseudomonadota bacterium]|nr:hypothetical protein [Pseudomonadota bacterium]
MIHTLAEISDSDFIQQFEDCSLDPVYFDHRGHLRLAWLYLSHFEFEEALEKISRGIQLYAGSLGADDKYHATITAAIVRIMAGRMLEPKEQNWQDFLAANRDLVEDALAVLGCYYSTGVLFTERARSEVIEPDLLAI